jgi:hypothetical protein
MTSRASHAIAFLSVLALLAGLRSAVRRRAVVDAPVVDAVAAWSDRSVASGQPCAASLSWRVARIDPRFPIDKADAEAAVLLAASLWEAAVGRSLFVRDTVRGLPIRFTYDERQAEGVARRAAQRALQASLDSLDARRGALDTLDPEAVAPRDELERLAREREGLWREFRERYGTVEGEAAHYAERIRAEGDRIVAVDREIRVYRFDGPSDLERTLAHELGHALGLGHADGEGAIMSERFDLGSEIPVPTALHPADVDLLREACSEWFTAARPSAGWAR